ALTRHWWKAGSRAWWPPGTLPMRNYSFRSGPAPSALPRRWPRALPCATNSRLLPSPRLWSVVARMYHTLPCNDIRVGAVRNSIRGLVWVHVRGESAAGPPRFYAVGPRIRCDHRSPRAHWGVWLRSALPATEERRLGNEGKLARRPSGDYHQVQ